MEGTWQSLPLRYDILYAKELGIGPDTDRPQMTCLFWFESTEGLKLAEITRSTPANALVQPLPSLARPHEQFQKWVYSVLSTTQVTQNVILLALLFIYRLKMSTPQIKGRAGSEYRLLTVALMLGNKCMS